MSRTRLSSSFFHSLRRERKLFALVGSLVLLLGVWQPFAFAGQGLSGAWGICHGMDSGPGTGPDAPQRDCPMCIGGLCASALAAAKALPPAGFSLAGPLIKEDGFAAVPIAPPMRGRTGPQPPIRAPPFAV
ncbi:MAG: hypothetical protein WDZ83_17975 [Rhizobiaceae bacterium]